MVIITYFKSLFSAVNSPTVHCHLLSSLHHPLPFPYTPCRPTCGVNSKTLTLRRHRQHYITTSRQHVHAILEDPTFEVTAYSFYVYAFMDMTYFSIWRQ